MRFNMRKDICAVMMAGVLAVGNVGVASAVEINFDVADEYVETVSLDDDVATVSSASSFESDGFVYKNYNNKNFIISEYNGSDEEIIISVTNGTNDYKSDIVQLTELSNDVKGVIIDAEISTVSMNSFSGKGLEYIRFLDNSTYDNESASNNTVICDI